MTATPARKRGARAEVPITADAIVETAFRMIDERGAEGFSMRSLAGELGVFPATLYWHVGDRSQLLGLVELRWAQGIELPDDIDDWREWMVELARRYRAHALRHPHVARLVTVERARNVETLRIPDAIIGKLSELGLGDQIVHAYNALMGAVRGFVVLELSMATDPPPPAEAEDLEAEMSGLDPEQFPHITQHFHLFADKALSIRWNEDAARSLDDSYEYLLRLLLDGIASQIRPPRKRT
jgi:TetR/AcrR family transcriptional regulator, tetracycline repressor protein